MAATMARGIADSPSLNQPTEFHNKSRATRCFQLTCREGSAGNYFFFFFFFTRADPAGHREEQ